MPKGLEAKKSFCVGGTVWKFREEMGYEFAWDGKKMSGLTARGTLWKVILLNGQFLGSNCWCECKSNWLIKIRSHLDKIEKEQEKVKWKKLSSLSRYSSFKKMVLERFNEHLPHFHFRSDCFFVL